MSTKHPSVNFHLTKACNMRCKFCFATFSDLNFVRHDFGTSEAIVYNLAQAGFKKITFAGGEPTLVRELPELLQHSKSLGMTTTIVTNGTKLSENKIYQSLIPHLDWVALSIDSVSEENNIASGRALHGKTTLTQNYYLELIRKLKSDGIRIKVNTVVSRFNFKENLKHFIETALPERWKVLQAMPVAGQNSEHQGEFEIPTNKFDEFLLRNHTDKCVVVPEPINLIRGSYVMVSPDGKFFDDTQGLHTYSQPILEVGVKTALQQVQFDFAKFQERGGEYNW